MTALLTIGVFLFLFLFIGYEGMPVFSLTGGYVFIYNRLESDGGTTGAGHRYDDCRQPLCFLSGRSHGLALRRRLCRVHHLLRAPTVAGNAPFFH